MELYRSLANWQEDSPRGPMQSTELIHVLRRYVAIESFKLYQPERVAGNALKYLKVCERRKEVLLIRTVTRNGCHMQSLSYQTALHDDFAM